MFFSNFTGTFSSFWISLCLFNEPIQGQYRLYVKEYPRDKQPIHLRSSTWQKNWNELEELKQIDRTLSWKCVYIWLLLRSFS